MRDRKVTLESVYLGAVLKHVMKDAGLNGTAIARQLGWNHTVASRLMKGTRGGTARQVVEWLDVCGVTGDLREEILRLRLPCGICGCRCDHNTALLACCRAQESRGAEAVVGIAEPRIEFEAGWIRLLDGRNLPPRLWVGAEIETMIEGRKTSDDPAHGSADRT